MNLDSPLCSHMNVCSLFFREPCPCWPFHSHTSEQSSNSINREKSLTATENQPLSPFFMKIGIKLTCWTVVFKSKLLMHLPFELRIMYYAILEGEISLPFLISHWSRCNINTVPASNKFSGPKYQCHCIVVTSLLQTMTPMTPKRVRNQTRVDSNWKTSWYY